MVLVSLTSALAAASLLLTAAAQSPTPTIKNPIETPTVTLPASSMVSIGCFATGTPLENHGPYGFQSPGNCQLICLQEKKNVMGTSDGVNCWCGDLIPAKKWQVDNSTCSTTCSGTDKELCGGNDKLWVVLTGNTRNEPEYFDPVSASSSTRQSSSQPTAVATATTTPSDPPSSGGGPNTVGIAVGVVVGIVALLAILGGVWFFMRRRRQQQAEEDYRRNAANVDSFVSGGKLHTSNSSMNDTRIDPSFMDRRQSNGSIADNEDYSRRILKVTNV